VVVPVCTLIFEEWNLGPAIVACPPVVAPILLSDKAGERARKRSLVKGSHYDSHD